MSRGTYSGTPFGFIQDKVYDQPGINVEGGLYSASDINLCDAISVGEDEGVDIGSGVSITAINPAVRKPGVNYEEVKLPTASSEASDFGGIVTATAVSRTDPKGNNYVDKGQISTTLKANRVGGRIWIKAYNAITAGSSLYWIIQDTSNHGFPIGKFSGSALGTDGADTVALTNIEVKTSASAGELALITLKP